jgi:hypothetical protein
MAEAVRGRIRLEPSSMWSGALYSDMNADNWRQTGMLADKGGGWGLGGPV